MGIPFFKYQGTGNDFIMIDNRDLRFPASESLIARLCDRRFGIGADGLILLENADGYDFRMVYFNADGKEGSMCGNGGRCTVRFAHDLDLFNRESLFIAVDGPHTGSVNNGTIRLRMSDVTGIEREEGYDFLNTGSPHVVIYTHDVRETDVKGIGRSIRYGELFGPRGGTNVNFVQVTGTGELKVRTYERGVEDETYSCGTGVTACALSAFSKYGWESPIRVEVEGGALSVDFGQSETDQFTEIYLTGPAEKVFEGVIPEALLYLQEPAL